MVVHFRSRFLKLALLAVALSLGAPHPGGAQETTLKIATIPIDVGAEVFYARDAGFFKKAGIDAQIQSITNGGAIAAAVASGAVDIGFSNLVSIATAFRRGVPITIIAPAGLYSTKAPTSVCVVARNSPIRSARDLDGKTFATNGLKNIAEFGPRAWIDKNGGDSSTVNFVEMPFPEMSVALAQGRVAAALLAEPSATEFKNSTRLLAKCFDAIAPRFMISAYITTTSWANAHRDLVRRFQEALRETAAWANKNHDQTADILAKEAKISPQVAHAMNRSEYPETIDPALIQPVIDVAAKYGGLGAPFPASEMIYK
jgi:ABC-type nitrate/sulfonate/bicarbonate transport system substrate-binding protein